jgi:hypothetical protein
MGLFVIAFGGLMVSSGLATPWVVGGQLSYAPLIVELITMVVMAVLALQTFRRLLKSQPLISVQTQ